MIREHGARLTLAPWSLRGRLWLRHELRQDGAQLFQPGQHAGACIVVQYV
jgi:hypothetical protein